MMFSTRAEYGVRVMIQLGRRHGGGPAPLAAIAEAEGLPLPYLEQLVARLRRADLVTATRGAHGGYELTRPPAEISMGEVVSALEGSMVPMQCFTEPGTTRVLCNHETDGYDHCATKLLWTRVQGSVARALEQTTLDELVAFSERQAEPPQASPAARTRTVRRRGRGTAAAQV
jgi:Rrf2 family transcriptional regulator, cysteine metabolism repressor